MLEFDVKGKYFKMSGAEMFFQIYPPFLINIMYLYDIRQFGKVAILLFLLSITA